MFDQKHHVPILKAKRGELTALRDCDDHIKDGLTPMLEVIGVAWDFQKGQEAETIDKHLEGFGAALAEYWGVDRRIFIESELIDNDRFMTDGTTHHLSFIFEDLRANNVSALPVTSLSKQGEYREAVKAIIDIDGRGLCLRVSAEDLTRPDLDADIDAELGFYGLTANEIDLVIDLGSLNDDSLPIMRLTLPTLLNAAIPLLAEWRSFTVAGTSFPSNLSAFTTDSVSTINRIEWALWNSLMASALNRYPTFGDYVISHPEMTEFNYMTMTVGVNLRYTSDTYWLVFKGGSLKKYGGVKRQALCALLVARPEFKGAAFSPGDQIIAECAAGTASSGNPETWRRVDTNHHLYMVRDQISSLLGA